MKKFDAAGKIDKVLLVSVLTLVGIGLLFVYSASMYTAEISYGNKYFFLFQTTDGSGCRACCYVCRKPCQHRFSQKVLDSGRNRVGGIAGLRVYSGLGIENYGAKRWIGFGSFSFQPSEIAKFAFVLFCAVYMSKKDMAKFSNSLAVVGVGVLFCGLIIAEPNMSITMCVAMLMVIMLFLGGMKWNSRALRRSRAYFCGTSTACNDCWRFWIRGQAPRMRGYQLIQSLYALGSGGFFSE